MYVGVPGTPARRPPPPKGPDCGVHYLWFAFVCFLIRSHPPQRTAPPSHRAQKVSWGGGPGSESKYPPWLIPCQGRCSFAFTAFSAQARPCHLLGPARSSSLPIRPLSSTTNPCTPGVPEGVLIVRCRMKRARCTVRSKTTPRPSAGAEGWHTNIPWAMQRSASRRCRVAKGGSLPLRS